MTGLYDILGLQTVINWNDVIKLVVRFAFNIAFAAIVIQFVYYRLYRNSAYAFTYYTFNIVTFCLCILMRKVPAELGFALAIFAIFGMLRYRTRQIEIKDLTYMIIVLGIAILNAIAYKNISLPELLFVNLSIVCFTAFYELGPLNRREFTRQMLYDRVDLLVPEKRAELLQDLEKRTGLKITRFEIQKMDFLRDSADIILHYNE